MGQWTTGGCALALVMVVGLGTAGKAVAQHQELAGIRTIAVVVESLVPDAREMGLTNERLRTKIELKLRLAGLRIEPVSQSPIPWLYVHVGVVRLPLPYEGIYAYNSNVVVYERARSGRTGLFVEGELWDKERISVSGRNSAQAGVEEDVSDLIDIFVNNWLAANPK